MGLLMQSRSKAIMGWERSRWNGYELPFSWIPAAQLPTEKMTRLPTSSRNPHPGHFSRLSLMAHSGLLLWRQHGQSGELTSRLPHTTSRDTACTIATVHSLMTKGSFTLLQQIPTIGIKIHDDMLQYAPSKWIYLNIYTLLISKNEYN